MYVYSFVSSSWSAKSSSGANSSSSSATGILIHLSRVDWDFRDIFRMWVERKQRKENNKWETESWIRNMQLALGRSAQLQARIWSRPPPCSAVRCASSAICCFKNAFSPPTVLCFCCYFFISIMNRLLFWISPNILSRFSFESGHLCRTKRTLVWHHSCLSRTSSQTLVFFL